MSKGKVLFHLTGSIACYKSCSVISRLVQNDYEVEVVASKSALEFVGEATLEGLTGRKVHTDTFARGQVMSHINLMKWADLAILCPATSNAINKFASGIGDDLVTSLFLAYDFNKPYLIAPAMNTHMYRHPATQESLQKLTQWGVHILETGSGNLACGDVGEGRLLEPDAIFSAIETALTPKSAAAPARALKVLITSGGTQEPIDGVRAITNFSSGRTGTQLASHFASRGHEVTLLRAKDSVTPSPPGLSIKTASFITFADLESLLKTELSSNRYDAVIHLAAVSDYSVESLETDGKKTKATASGKIDSEGALTIHLKRNRKIVDQLRSFSSNPATKVIAFKLTNTKDHGVRMAAVQKLASHARPDWIVQNDLSEIEGPGGKHRSRIFSDDSLSNAVAETETKSELARELERLLLESIERKRLT